MRWRKLWPPLFLWLVGMTAGQTADPENQVQDGKLIRFQLDSGTSASFSLSPPDDSSAAAARTYFVTLNICSHPKNAKFSTLPQQTLLSAIDPDDTGKILDTASTKYGFANLSRTVPRDSNDKGMRVTIDAPASEQDQRDAGWTFELGISTSEPLHLLDRTPLFSLQDTDNTSLLVTGPTFFPSLSQDKGGGDPGSQLWLIPTSVDDNGASDPLNQLSQSSCFISNSSNLIEASQIKASNTTRGTFTLSPQEGAIGIQKDQHKDGGQRTQFHVTDLDPGTNYTIWGSQNTSQSGVRLFKQQFAVTKSCQCFPSLHLLGKITV